MASHAEREQVGDAGEEIETPRMEQTEQNQDGSIAEGDIPPPPTPEYGVERPTVRRPPMMPSRQEVLEHYVTHIPFRSWCAHCVAGKCKSKPHFQKREEEESDVPLIAFDYAFMSETYTEDGAEEKADLKILVGRDRKSKVPIAISVPSKGIDADEYAVRRILRYLNFLGYGKTLLKSDQES